MAQAGDSVKCPNCGAEATLDTAGNPPKGWIDAPEGYYCSKEECHRIGMFGSRPNA